MPRISCGKINTTQQQQQWQQQWQWQWQRQRQRHWPQGCRPRLMAEPETEAQVETCRLLARLENGKWKLKTIYANRTTFWLRLTWLGGQQQQQQVASVAQSQVHWLPEQPHSNHNWNWTLCFSISLFLYLSLSFSNLRRLICFAVLFWMVSSRSLFGCCWIAICHWPFTIFHFPLTIWHLCLLLAAAAHPKLISNTAAVTFDTLNNGFVRSTNRFLLPELSMKNCSNRNRKLWN